MRHGAQRERDSLCEPAIVGHGGSVNASIDYALAAMDLMMTMPYGHLSRSSNVKCVFRHQPSAALDDSNWVSGL